MKDRTALSIVQEGERSGALRPGKTIIDCSSGNTAIGLALVGRARGYPVELVMPESVSRGAQAPVRGLRRPPRLHRRVLGLGRRAPAGAGDGGRRARRYFYADQYRNPANPLAHYRTTGPEIWEQTSGRITHFVAGLGTTGTVVGTGRFLHERNPPGAGGGGGARRAAARPRGPEAPGERHGARDLGPSGARRRLSVSTEDGLAGCAEVMASDGLFIGHSAGAAVWAAQEVAGTLDRGVVVALLSDGGERYLPPRRAGEDSPRRGRAHAGPPACRLSLEVCGAFLGRGCDGGAGCAPR